ncbi:MAG TPA: aminomethyl-transferring glycine dehydrogenase subunit GcvPA [Spirochaetota bacterium]|nr:aminomethyl-transferring glycine dehydrogenase subunit GcvPA [Spirochaetota bacterium]
MKYTCSPEDDRYVMLKSIGVRAVDDLFTDIPEAMRLGKDLDLPSALSEIETMRLMEELAAKNRPGRCFAGAGAYVHYMPAVVDALASRSEFYTAYTPYQAEVSQGTLTAIFEFQTFVCRLTGMDVANASMYDGATALAEAVLMSMHASGKKSVVAGDTLHPHYRAVLETYCGANGLELRILPSANGVMDTSALAGALNSATAAVVTQNPNFFGCIEDVAAITGAAHVAKAHSIVVVTEPHSLGLIAAPGKLGVDILCGEAQSFGNPVGYGGPALGFLAAKGEFMRRMPGRLVGKTVDSDGKDAYALTLQTREQHIRREKATSNICTNQGLCALRAVIYLSALGNAIRPLAELNHRLAARCKSLLASKGFTAVFDRPYFNEFAVGIKKAPVVMKRLEEEGFIPGVHLGDYYGEYADCVLVCCTEMTSPAEIDAFAEAVKRCAR